jgi:hypothetical protein
MCRRSQRAAEDTERERAALVAITGMGRLAVVEGAVMDNPRLDDEQRIECRARVSQGLLGRDASPRTCRQGRGDSRSRPVDGSRQYRASLNKADRAGHSASSTAVTAGGRQPSRGLFKISSATHTPRSRPPPLMSSALSCAAASPRPQGRACDLRNSTWSGRIRLGQAARSPNRPEGANHVPCTERLRARDWARRGDGLRRGRRPHE